MRQCVDDLAQHGHLLRITEEIDPHLEAAEIQRRVFQSGGPALLFANVKGCKFPMVSNLFGTMDRTRFIFRKTIENVKRLIDLKVDPANLAKDPLRYGIAGLGAFRMLPRRVRRGPVMANRTTLDELPKLQSWPMDGGPFVTLPQVYTENVESPGVMKSNLGMYRVQISGNQYEKNKEIGLHYQIHRGIGVHHKAALRNNKPFHVNIFVGGTPAMTVAAVMPLPEGLSELTFAGALAGHRIRMATGAGPLPIYGDADFVICGTIKPDLMPEGPFGDHLGYYSLEHLFPALEVSAVYHRDDAIWPFTVVGRPPQEDTMFGELIHEITGPVIPTVVHGVRAVNAVDAAGVHPLMLAIGSERYVPYEPNHRPREILTQANAILGQGQMSLAKYLMIIAGDDDPDLKISEIAGYFQHLLKRIDWTRDLHFQTCTTIDTLDYSGTALNEGSKVVMAAAGPVRRELPTELPELGLPPGFSAPHVCQPGILAVTGPTAVPSSGEQSHSSDVHRFCEHFDASAPINAFPLVLIVDDAEFTAATLNNFLWVTFTRSNPASDIHGIQPFIRDKHWGCEGSLVIDARKKPRHAPELLEDPKVTAKVDAMATKSNELAKWL
jgi:4-hydroxy-3-polyprenylbenzoate decarboxylase